MKNYIYSFFTPLYKLSFLLPIIRILHRIIFALSNLLKTTLDIADEEKTVCRLAHRISPDNLVIQGRFAGQKYSNSASVGSSFLPKILGTYEIELEPAWELISDIDFDVVIDIGCAEGFYACGLANMYPLADVYAFDTDMRARQYCEQNAKINDLNNVTIQSLCTTTALSELCSGRSSFILCDIEGAEKELFSGIDKSCLTNTCILVEIHDGVDPTISVFFKTEFKASHNLTSFFSTDDLHRPRVWSSFNIPKLSDQDLYLAMKENRGHIMEWILLLPK